MGQPQQPSHPAPFPGSLRLAFWQVAGQRDPGGCRTPFEKIRLDRDKNCADMAYWLHMNVEDYIDMEEGKLTPRVTDILSFCKVMNCTPLDLYDAGQTLDADMPLPAEILESLTDMLDDDEFSDGDREKARFRLRQEYQRARSMVRNNASELLPLLLSLGYTRDLRGYNAPLYLPPQKGGDAPDPVWAMMDEGAWQKGVYMENCLVLYQSQIEKNVSIQRQIFIFLDEPYSANFKLLKQRATALYGEDDVAAAIESIRHVPKQNRIAFQKLFLDDPGILHPVSAKSVQEKDQLRKRAGMFLLAAWRHFAMKPGRDKAAGHLSAACAVEADFKTWCAKPRTDRLMHWYENWATLHAVPAVSMLSFNLTHSPAQSRMFPPLPR